VPAKQLDDAEKLFKEYFDKGVALFGPHFASYTIHNTLHFVEDLRNYPCHADNGSTYDFETFHQIYRKLMFPGPKQHLQIRCVRNNT
jgi:hypothetical protein